MNVFLSLSPVFSTLNASNTSCFIIIFIVNSIFFDRSGFWLLLINNRQGKREAKNRRRKREREPKTGERERKEDRRGKEKNIQPSTIPLPSSSTHGPTVIDSASSRIAANSAVDR